MGTDGLNTDWQKHIKNRVRFAKEWRQEAETHKRLAERFLYIRINGTSFRPISISPENPCGRLLSQKNKAVIGGLPNIRLAIEAAADALPADSFAPDDGREKAKPEHRIQAMLIRCALQNNLRFDSLFTGFDHVFEELLFVEDELSAGALRADIIALGRKADTYFPVFMELKVGRELTRLMKQLEHARNAMMGEIQKDFIQYLSAFTGVAAEKIANQPQLILVWRDSPSTRESKGVGEARTKGFITGALRGGHIYFVGNKTDG